jgi:hypothetical protein
MSLFKQLGIIESIDTYIHELNSEKGKKVMEYVNKAKTENKSLFDKELLKNYVDENNLDNAFIQELQTMNDKYFSINLLYYSEILYGLGEEKDKLRIINNAENGLFGDLKDYSEDFLKQTISIQNLKLRDYIKEEGKFYTNCNHFLDEIEDLEKKLSDKEFIEKNNKKAQEFYMRLNELNQLYVEYIDELRELKNSNPKGLHKYLKRNSRREEKQAKKTVKIINKVEKKRIKQELKSLEKEEKIKVKKELSEYYKSFKKKNLDISKIIQIYKNPVKVKPNRKYLFKILFSTI